MRKQGGLLTALGNALERRAARLEGVEPLRLFDGEDPARSSLFLDRMGPVLIAHVLAGSPGLEDELRKDASSVIELCGASTLYLRVHARDAHQTSEAELLAGRRNEELIVREGAIDLIVRPEANVNAGLFLDTREVRSVLSETSSGAAVLNTFCFTGSLGLAALKGGAREVVQVDASKSALRWARQNLELNRPGVRGEMRFICEDTLSFMSREARRGRRYDVVILDPPAFGRSAGGIFSLERDVEKLVRLAVSILEERARLFLLCNHRAFEPERLADLVRGVCSDGRRIVLEETLLYPPSVDFPNRSASSISMRGVLVGSMARDRAPGVSGEV